MDAREETLNLLQKIWAKLQGLPSASPLELGAFLVLVLFIGTILLLVLLVCVQCCCCGNNTRHKDPKT